MTPVDVASPYPPGVTGADFEDPVEELDDDFDPDWWNDWREDR